MSAPATPRHESPRRSSAAAYAVCISILVIPDTVLGNARYRETLWVWLVLLAAYFPVMEGLTGYSVGKFIARARVIDDRGNVPGIWRAAIRTIFRLLEVNPVFLGGIPAGLVANFSKSGQRLGDMSAGTYVVPAPLSETFGVSPNHSIELTSNGLRPSDAAHVKR